MSGSHMQPSAAFAAGVNASPCHFVVTGASGWLGRATLAMLRAALGEAGFAARVSALGSRAAELDLGDGRAHPVHPLADWAPPPGQPLLVFHYAFLTKDKVGALSMQDYVARNGAIGATVRRWIDAGAVRGVVLPSSGAVYDHLHASARDPAAGLYGRLKYEDEVSFGAACAAAGVGLVIPRVFNLSGPYINKFDTYALASFIAQIVNGQPLAIHARRPVIRSYYFIGDLIELCVRLLLGQDAAATIGFDVAGTEIVELGELAQRVAAVLAARRPVLLARAPLAADAAPDRYLGDPAPIRRLEAGLGMQPMPLAAQIEATWRYIDGAPD